MITRGFNSTYRAGCAGAPPPLHITDDNPASAWFPAERPDLIDQPPGPVMLYIKTPAPFGDDPLNPAAQTVPRHATMGMIGRLNFGVPHTNVRGSGVRR
jgi:hypothetical protein